MTGMWRTDAPLTPEKMDEQRAALNSVTAALDTVEAYAGNDVLIEDVTVYVDGVQWTWQPVRVVGGRR